MFCEMKEHVSRGRPMIDPEQIATLISLFEYGRKPRECILHEEITVSLGTVYNYYRAWKALKETNGTIEAERSVRGCSR